MQQLIVRTILFWVEFVVTAKAVDFGRYVVSYGVKIEGDWSTVTGLPKAFLCCLECEKTTNCTAVNYNIDIKTCELVKQTPNVQVSMTISSGWNAYLTSLKDINVLANGVASQSSTYWRGPARKAIDGNTNGYYLSGSSCSHTNHGVEKWWMVDFQNIFPVTMVIIWNRVDPNDWRGLNGLRITVGRSLQSLNNECNTCGYYVGPPARRSDNPVNITCSRKMYGRFLKIEKDRSINKALCLCEVNVISEM